MSNKLVDSVSRCRLSGRTRTSRQTNKARMPFTLLIPAALKIGGLRLVCFLL